MFLNLGNDILFLRFLRPFNKRDFSLTLINFLFFMISHIFMKLNKTEENDLGTFKLNLFFV